MRRLVKRPNLPVATTQKLAVQTGLIVAGVSPKEMAAKLYMNARGTKWFAKVIDALRHWSGPGERCMYCSSSESSDVEHFQPKAVYPDRAMNWENFLWSCGICNSYKLNQFPDRLDEIFINPAEENPWDFFYIDEYGNLAAKWSALHNKQHPRAVSTLGVAKIDRQAVQDSRRRRFSNLKQQVKDSLDLYDRGQLTKADLTQRLDDWLALPFQPDVADYFLNGPGAIEKPFRRFLEIARPAP